MEDLHLPPELVSYLEDGRLLDYDPADCEVGEVELYRLGSLRLAMAWASSGGKPWEGSDPNRGVSGHYEVPCVSLIAECEGYDAWGILCWFPKEQQFGTVDTDHEDIFLFGKEVGWDTICSDPLRWLNYQWRADDRSFLNPHPDHAFQSEAVPPTQEPGSSNLSTPGVDASLVGNLLDRLKAARAEAPLNSREARWFQVNPRPGPDVLTEYQACMFDLEGHKPADFSECKVIDGWRGTGFVQSDPDSDGPLTNVLLTSNMVPVVDSAVKALVDQLDSNSAQWLPIEVRSSNGSPMAQYFVLNTTREVDALEYSCSDIVYYTAKGSSVISYIRRIVLKRSRIENSECNLFRLKDYHYSILVSHRFRDAFKRLALTGWGFERVEIDEGS